MRHRLQPSRETSERISLPTRQDEDIVRVGGKEAVSSGFSHVKKAVGKSGLMGGVLNTFGDIDIADELRDMWTHESKDLERTYLIRTLQDIAHQKGIRMTFLSGGKCEIFSGENV